MCVCNTSRPLIGQWGLNTGLWLADHDPSLRPGDWCQVMAPRIIPAQRRLRVKTGPDNQRIIKPQCDTNVRQQIAPRNADTRILQTRVPTCTRGQGHTRGHKRRVEGITWARCVGFYGGCVFANPASGWTFPATKYSKHNLVHYNLMIFLTEQRFGCRKSFLCEFYRLLRLRFVVKFQQNFYSSCKSKAWFYKASVPTLCKLQKRFEFFLLPSLKSVKRTKCVMIITD